MTFRSILSMFLATVFILVGFTPPQNTELHVAVASNFASTMKTIASNFKDESGHHVVIISGSTGKHYAQITQGAPYDIFFSADDTHPRLLESDGVAVPDSRFTYAIGKVVLWSPKKQLVDSSGSVLNRLSDLRLAIANPMHAPYGRAAQEILEARNLWNENTGRIVRGENINQAYHFVESGNADLGFVAYSQVVGPIRRKEGSVWLVPQDLYSPIEQQAVLLVDSDVSRQFISYVKSDESRQILRDAGYDTP